MKSQSRVSAKTELSGERTTHDSSGAVQNPRWITRAALFVCVVVVVIAFAGLFLVLHSDDLDPNIQFALQDHQGALVTQDTYLGRPLLVFFGFTHCPEICPTQMAKLSRAVEQWDAQTQSEAVLPLFISVDPKRDSIGRLADYVAHFHPRFIGLTGSPEALASARRSFNAIAIATTDGDSARHTSVAYLVNSAGRLITHIPGNATVEDALERITEAEL